MVTPKSLRADAALKRAEADALDAAADAMEKLSGEAGLPRTTDYAKLRYTMQARADVRDFRKVGRPMERDHAFTRALTRANVTMTEYAAKLRKNRSTVKSWLDRPIPEAMAKFIESDLGVPATIASWPAGIK